jgi:TolA-binding protein
MAESMKRIDASAGTGMTDFYKKRMSRNSIFFLLLAAAPCADSRFARAQDDAPPVAQPANAGAAAIPDTNAAPVAEPVTTTDTSSTNAAPGTTPGLVILNPAAERFDSAMATFQAGHFADAVTAFSDFVRDFPQDRRREEALFRLAESYRNLGRTADALAAYTFEVQAYPEGPLRIEAELRRGAIFFDQGKISEAIAPLQRVADRGDGELKEAADYLLGRCFLATQKEAAGRALLQPLADAQPPGKYTGEAAQALAELEDTEGHSPQALALWQTALPLAADPAIKATIAARGGWSALGANQSGAAEKLFQAARGFAPTGNARKVANTGLLRLLFQQKRYAEWVAIYGPEKENLLDSARAETLYDLGHAEFATKHWSEAAEAFDQYLREFSTDPNAVTAAYERFLAGAQIDATKTVNEAEAYLKAWPQSPYRARVQLVEAQQLSAEKNFTDAAPLWKSLSQEAGDASWPHQDILLELAGSYDALHDWANAATAYQAYLDADGISARQTLRVQARLAVCLQNADQLAAATQAWQAVQSEAPAGSAEQEAALESLALIYARGGPAQATAMADTFRALLEKFPQSPLRAMAAFSVGDALFKNRDYAGAEPFLLHAREWDSAAWRQPATQRLALGAYGLKDVAKALAYLKEYDAIPLPADALAREAARLPAAFYYWLAEDARKNGHWSEAEALYLRVTQHPHPGDLLAGAWWQLGEAQSQRKEWPAAVASYEQYRALKPDSKDATVVLLALGRAQLGAQNLDAAKALGQQALLQEPEGPNSAAARTLLAETALSAHSNVEAARMFATLAVLFDDPKITPQAMARAADAFDAAGDATDAAQWRQKLQAKYPQFQPVPYL